MDRSAATWIKSQLSRLVDEAPGGGGWLHEIKYDGYRMHARIYGRDIKLLTPWASTGRTATDARSRRCGRSAASRSI
jgi:bifunctional non-homologous end joining protein LigD